MNLLAKNKPLFELVAILALSPSLWAEQARPNVLIVTVDDMSADSIGAFGCQLADTTPNIDAFARQALRFQHAHVTVGNCMPGRNVMWSGLFSHVNGVEGFMQNKSPDYPVLCDLARDAGYFAAIRGKVGHSTPYTPYAWDAVLDSSADGQAHHVKDPASYGKSTRRGIRMAQQAGKPFCLLINIADPHKPFYSQQRGNRPGPDPYVPSRVFEADEVPVPGFLPDDDVVRRELALYYSTVRRADDCFAEIMTALEESGQSDETFVLFFSDHGMPFPFAKTQLYHHSTHTPMMVRLPGVTRPDSIDQTHMVSAIDLLPTLLEIMQTTHPHPGRLHGRSFAPLIFGRTQDDRDHVVLQYNENSRRDRHPMRGIQSKEYLYLFNPWSDGSRRFTTATMGTMTYRQMVKRAEDEADIYARLRLFDHRVVEELYDVRNDPNCLVNLIDDPDHQATVSQLREKLAHDLSEIDDPVAPLLVEVDNVALRAEFMEREDERASRNRAIRKKNRSRKVIRKP